ncbi:polygalacturonase QRT3-like isoform X2 [Tasmannia lanceolata]|uniref:polygalacturonase QRT3-like isoform X2 n=1 Tax=Tasmannia lanceolata TaxID=3420 RepID=UPI0040638C9F
MSSFYALFVSLYILSSCSLEGRKTKGRTMGRNVMLLSVFMGLSSLIIIHGYEENPKARGHFGGSSLDRIYRMELIKASLLRSQMSPSSSFPPIQSAPPSSRVHRVTTYGADPTGANDSTDAILAAISDAFRPPGDRILMPGIADLGGSEVHLEGGTYKISRPLRLPATGGGNLMIHGGSLRASDDFPNDRHLIELWPSSVPKLDSMSQQGEILDSSSSSSYEDITLKDLMLDSNFNGGAISVISSLRTTIDNCYITHFSTDGILVQGGHETYIRNSFLGQHITDGGDPGERNFSGIAINLMGNDNAVTDVVIFSAAIGILVSGQANILNGVHCYNKATGWGGTGIYLRLPGLTQTRIVNCYMDFTGIVAEDPVQLEISSSFFLGNAYVKLKSVNGVMRGVNIVDNMFSGSGGTDIVQLDQSSGPFTTVDQVIIDRNNVLGMTVKATAARGSVKGNGSIWTVDFSQTLLFPNLIRHVQYTFQASALFPNHALRNTTANRVVIESDVAVPATVYVSVDQNNGSVG